MTIDKYKIRKQNESLLISKILESSKISRIKLSKITSLNKTTVSDIIQKFIDDKILVESGNDVGSKLGGKKPILVELNKKAGFIISIELGTDYVSYCLASIDGSLIEFVKDKNFIPNKNNCFEIIDFIYNKYKSSFENAPFALIGISIAIHGIVDDNKILFTPNYDIDKVNLYNELLKKYNIPIFIENEADLVVIGEATFLKDSPNVVGLSVHSGIGAGIILNKDLVKGTFGSIGEIGHTILFPKGKHCKCGNRGCLELYASLNALIVEYNNLSKVQLDLDQICDKYNQNEELAIEVVNNNCFLLSQAINNILAFISPDIIFIQSPLINKIPGLINIIKNNINNIWLKKSDIKISRITRFAAIYGGVSLVIKSFFNIEKNIFINKEKE